VAARLDTESLERAVTAIGLRSQRFTGKSPDAAVITAPTTWNSVERLIAELEVLNAAPCIARYEASKQGEVLQ